MGEGKEGDSQISAGQMNVSFAQVGGTMEEE